ncbi:hypothetical protein CJF30_00001781 [Rutstroemia sp. NJR-2017a BBW]|nr:hypothetical protein CJF30_00001781 [Rutstroemia sp. NJR-2017a BBW]
MPEIDVLIHTGDLTNFGELKSLEESVRMIGTISAELKLVIAGNHDIPLDKTNRVENMTDEEYSKYHASAMEIMTGPMANGSTFSVYASPYTIGSGGWAFPYKSNEDRFNDANQTAANKVSVSENPIPLGVHIVMTHGPPYSILDQVDGQNLGCPSLLRAVGRVRPLMHCFGHIHEGHGANIVTWKPDGKTEQINEYPYANEWPVQPGKQTLMVNAAIMRNTARGMRPDYKPFIVSLDLPHL